MKFAKRKLFLMICLLTISFGITASGKERLSKTEIVVNKGSSFTVCVSGGSIATAYYTEKYVKPVSVKSSYSSWRALRVGETAVDIRTKSGKLLSCRISIHGIKEGDAVLNAGESLQFHFHGGTPKWSSSNKSVLSVSASGLAEAKKAGTATVTGRAGRKVYRCRIRVKDEAHKVSKKTLVVDVGKTGVLPAENIGNARVTVDGDGIRVTKTVRKGKLAYVVLGVRPGTWKVTISHNGKNYVCRVTVPECITDIHKLAPKAPAEVRRKFVESGGAVEYDGSLEGLNGAYRPLSNRIILKYKGTDTCYHELGHFLHQIRYINEELHEESKEVFKAEKKLYRGENPKYTTASYTEYFAQSFKEYCLKPSRLRAERPETYKLIRKYIRHVNDGDIPRIM